MFGALGSRRQAELRALNRACQEAWAREADGWFRLMLETPTIDRALQDQYVARFPECITQTVFVKHLAAR